MRRTLPFPVAAALLLLVAGREPFAAAQPVEPPAAAPAEDQDSATEALAPGGEPTGSERELLYFEVSVGVRMVLEPSTEYWALWTLYNPDWYGDEAFLLGDFGLAASYRVLPWLEVGGGARLLYGSLDFDPWLPMQVDAWGLELTAHVRPIGMFLEDLDGEQWGGLFLDVALGVQVPIVVAHGEPDADAVFVLRPALGIVMGTDDVQWVTRIGYAAAFSNEGWNGNPGPSLSGLCASEEIRFDLLGL